MNSSVIELSTDQSWSKAKRYARYLSPIPPSVQAAVSSLWTDHLDSTAAGTTIIGERTLSQVRRVERSEVLKTPLYFAAMNLFEEEFKNSTEDDTSKALLGLLGPGLFASLLSLIYCHRRMNKVADEEGWAAFSGDFVLNMEIGLMIGSSVPSIGPALGCLLGGIRYAALSTFLVHEAQQLIGYRNLKKDKLDFLFEQERWGCDHAQIASCILRELGVRKDVLEMARALRKEEFDDAGEKLSLELLRWRMSIDLIDRLKEGNDSLNGLETELFPDLEQVNLIDLKMSVDWLVESGTTFTWMMRSSKETS